MNRVHSEHVKGYLWLFLSRNMGLRVTEKTGRFLSKLGVHSDHSSCPRAHEESASYARQYADLNVQPSSMSAVSLVRHAAELRKISLHNTLSQRS
jgi:hypothetical protein